MSAIEAASTASTASAAAVDRRPQGRLECDVLVVGGGAAGLAAACTAARQGLDVLLLERYGFCGGAAVAGFSGTVCGLYLAHPGAAGGPQKVVHGFVDQFIAAMQRHQGLTGPVRYGDTYTLVHEPFAWRVAADDLLAEAGVRVLYHAQVIAALVEGGERIDGALINTKQGRFEVRAKLTIDASGDADVFAMAGLATTVGHEGKVQNPTMIFRIAGVDVARFLGAYGPDSILPASVSDELARANDSGDYWLPRHKVFLFPTPRAGELLCNCTRIMEPGGAELHPLVAAELSRAETLGRHQARDYARFFRDQLVGCEQSFLLDTGVQVGVRQSRQIVGVQTLRNSDVVQGSKRADGIARSPWPIELHSGHKPRLSWLYDDTYDIPLGCFVPPQSEGLLAAGRCLSAEHEAMASARVTAQCFSYGHAVGHAAAMAVQDRLGVRDIAPAAVRQRLVADGAVLTG
jgi:hypothetical protein